MKKRGALFYLFLLLPLLFLFPPAHAALKMEIAVGIAGRFVPAKPTPVKIRIGGIQSPFDGSITFTQKVGNPWRGEAVSKVEFSFLELTDGAYERIIPIYDFIHPLKVKLADKDGKVLISKEIDLRSRHLNDPFPLAAGRFPINFGEDAVIIDPSKLPNLWPVYQGTKSLWVGRIPDALSKERWRAIEGWVLTGGSAVLFTGSDFYLLDSPTFRHLIPVQNPGIEKVKEQYYLKGKPKPGAEVLLWEEGRPLLITQRYGAGRVFLVTKNAFSLDDKSWEKVRNQVSPANFISLSDTTAGLLKKTELEHPSHSAAIILVFLALASFTLIASRTRESKRTFLYLLLFGSLLIILTGWYGSGAKTINNLYCLKTTLSIKTTAGYRSTWYALFATNPLQAKIKTSTHIPPIQKFPRDLHEHTYDLRWEKGGLWLNLDRGEARYFHTLSDYTPPVKARINGEGGVRIENLTDHKLEEAVVIDGGQIFPIGEVNPGEDIYYLGNGYQLGPQMMTGPSFNPFFERLIQGFSFKGGMWLVGAREDNSYKNWGGLRIKVKDIKIYVVKGEKFGYK